MVQPQLPNLGNILDCEIAILFLRNKTNVYLYTSICLYELYSIIHKQNIGLLSFHASKW